MKDFLFKPEQAQCPVSALSGGEKNRLMLAVALAKPSNFLILDEPTNDLDMDTLDLLQEVLSEYEGTILIVSHDRDFLDKVATSLIYMKGDGKISEFVGSYSDLLEKEKNNSLPQKTKPTTQKQPADKNTPQKNKSKLSYNEKRLLEILPQKIAEAEEKIAQIESKLSNTNLYLQDENLFNSLSKELELLKKQIDEDETKWLEINELADDLC